ncbi:hypothetical protein EBB79_11935 [Parasedimentitalea marina]|uniref:Transposase n=1 Tax=Parasedimentitalea marina TaxID=2483033 RepID=A0A3T0N3A0_9RHOB|nr:hypothetical protein EBB79_11935 [Parasedimentitalea marina]
MTKRKNHSAGFNARVSVEAIREDMTVAGLGRKYGVHLLPVGFRKQTPRGDPDHYLGTFSDQQYGLDIFQAGA